MSNAITITGNLTREPEIRYTKEGQATAQLGVAVNRRWQDRTTQEWQEATAFFDVVCWRDLASEWHLLGARVGTLQGEADDDCIAHCPDAIELSVHVGECRPVLPHGIVQVFGALVGDSYGVVDEDTIVGKACLPSLEIHSFSSCIRLTNK